MFNNLITNCHQRPSTMVNIEEILELGESMTICCSRAVFLDRCDCTNTSHNTSEGRGAAVPAVSLLITAAKM